MKTVTATRGTFKASALADIAYDDQEFSRLIGGVYSAALEPSRWPDVLAEAAEFVGGCAAGLFYKDTTAQRGCLRYSIGIEPHYQQSYFDKYIGLDPATTGHLRAEIEQPMATADLIPYREFIESRFYREWARPQGLVDFLSAVLDRSTAGVAMFGVFRHERDGVVDAAARHRMRLIVPHVRRAVLIARMFDLKAAEAATLADTFDGLSAGMCLVSVGGRVVHANAAAQAMFGKGEILRVVNGRLVAREPRLDQTLREMIVAAGSGAALGSKGTVVPLVGKDGERYVAHVLPLTSDARRRAGVTDTAVAALFIRNTSVVAAAPAQVIGRAFKLTPAEIRVLLAIVEVGGVPEVAAAFGVADTTIKTHLSRLFEKTGATRQADLVKLVAGYATPFIH